MGRLLWGAFFLSALILGAMVLAEAEVPLEPEEAVQRELNEKVTQQAIEEKIEAAFARNDIEDARMYVDLALEMHRPIRMELIDRVEAAEQSTAAAERSAMEFGTSFITGEGTSIAGLAGATASDFTVVGDVRDIIHEGGLMISGQPYDKLMLGLATVGLAATGATVATGGLGAPAKVGVSLFKAARRAGTLTVELGVAVGRAVRQAVDFGELGGVVRAAATFDNAAVRDAASVAVRRASSGSLARMLGDARHINDIAGPAETVRLLKYAKSPEELSGLARMSTRFGKSTRGVVELTGRTSLRAFKQGVRIAAVIIENLFAFIGWFVSLIGMMLTRGIWRFSRRKRRVRAIRRAETA